MEENKKRMEELLRMLEEQTRVWARLLEISENYKKSLTEELKGK